MKLVRRIANEKLYRQNSYTELCIVCKDAAGTSCKRCFGGLCESHGHTSDTRCRVCEADYIHRRPLETLFVWMKLRLGRSLPQWLVGMIATLVVAFVSLGPAIALSSYIAWVSWYGVGGTMVPTTNAIIGTAIGFPLVLNYMGARAFNLLTGRTRMQFLGETRPSRSLTTEDLLAA